MCCGDVESALAAHRGGADRIELCANLPEGGTTPSFGAIRRVAETLRAGRSPSHDDADAAADDGFAAGCRLHVLIRPRAGNFVYSAAEIAAMVDDVAAAKRAGAHGVVIGALTPAGALDVDALAPLAAAARPEMTVSSPPPLRAARFDAAARRGDE